MCDVNNFLLSGCYGLKVHPFVSTCAPECRGVACMGWKSFSFDVSTERKCAC